MDRDRPASLGSSRSSDSRGDSLSRSASLCFALPYRARSSPADITANSRSIVRSSIASSSASARRFRPDLGEQLVEQTEPSFRRAGRLPLHQHVDIGCAKFVDRQPHGVPILRSRTHFSCSAREIRTRRFPEKSTGNTTLIPWLISPGRCLNKTVGDTVAR